MRLENRVAVITGGARGIGRTIAEIFHKEGARVVIAARNIRNLQGLASQLNQGSDHRLVPFRCDVRDRGEGDVLIGNVVELWERVDILVNNAGISGVTPLIPADGEEEAIDRRWSDILATNLTGVYYCTRAAVRHMPGGGQGRVLNISSVLGKFGVPWYGAYCASKHGVIGLTKALAHELAPRGITVNAICPGWVDTDMSRQGIEESARLRGVAAGDFRRAAERDVPLGRFVPAAEIAQMATYLASDAGGSITGQAINVDGGAAMW